MENQKQADNESEFVLDNRKVVLIFFGFLVICGCFFVAGYVFGNRAVPQPVNYAGTNTGGNSIIKDSSGGEAYGRVNEIADETYPARSAVSEPLPAAAEPAVSAAPPEIATVILDGEPSAPPKTTVIIPTAAVSDPAVTADKPKPQTKETPNTAARVPAEKSSSSAKQPASAKTVYSVQVAALRVRSEVEARVNELKAKGFDFRIEPPLAPGDYYRLKVGSFATRAEANEMANRLKKSGFETWISENRGN